MKRFTTWIIVAAFGLALVGALNGCAALGALADLKHLQFKLDNVSNFRLNGVDVSRAATKGDIGFSDIASLTAAVIQKRMPADFTLNVAVRNPNTSSGGHAATDLYLRKIAWTLSIDDRTTISGVTDQRLQIPGTGQTVNLPITMSVDLYKFFGDRGVDDLINLGLALGGRSGSASRLKLTARVTAEVPPLAPIEYPGDITIVDKSFSNP
ncbi:MAG TPA: LEA type 2 family protein [Candidatus Kapabacteria bacterium]|nr:LEA type 2 family protein [Candidatus Kapabacteria bacterium]